MNQILGNPNMNDDKPPLIDYSVKFKGEDDRDYHYDHKRASKASRASVVRAFAVAMIIFGVLLIGKSVYALNSSENRLKDNPQVSMERMGREVTVAITTKKPIKEMQYKWNDGEETTVAGNNTVNMSKVVEVPNGNNILKVTVVDFYGNKTYYKRQYIYESSDMQKPKIDIAITGNRLKITASDDQKLAYITYKWNNDQETRINNPDDSLQFVQEIDVMPGQNTLTINAVDGEDNKTTRSEKIIGDTKPDLSISTEGNSIVVKAKDDEGIQKIAITVDGQTSEQDNMNQKEATAKLPLTTGNHKIKVTVTNVNGLQNTKELSAGI